MGCVLAAVNWAHLQGWLPSAPRIRKIRVSKIGDRRPKRTGGGAEFGPTWSSVRHRGRWQGWGLVEGHLALRPAFFFIDSRKR